MEPVASNVTRELFYHYAVSLYLLYYLFYFGFGVGDWTQGYAEHLFYMSNP